VYITAHIGNIPVEEWLPFTVPVIGLYLYGRHRDRRRRAAIGALPAASDALDDDLIKRVLARWSAADHRELSPDQVPLLYPPGPDGVTAAELASRIHRDPLTVNRLLEELEDLGYVESDAEGDTAERRAWLTVEGYDLVKLTEDALLAASSTVAHQPDVP
jgi:DNA-binding MarR family transcriptional regulator